MIFAITFSENIDNCSVAFSLLFSIYYKKRQCYRFYNFMKFGSDQQHDMFLR